MSSKDEAALPISEGRPATPTKPTPPYRRSPLYDDTMTTSLRRIDTTDPRRHDKIQPLRYPAAWSDDNIDIYGFLLSSATMISGMAMVTRFAPLAYMGLLFGLANYAHEKPHQAKKESASNAGGPIMGLS
jgi:hypothetical protein